MKKLITSLIVIACLGVGYLYQDHSNNQQNSTTVTTTESTTVVIHFPSDKYPETAKHIKDAIAAGETKVCTIDRKDGDEHRKESLKDVPTKHGYDRDEFPMAMCKEGGTGANIEYISPSDNRGAGSWVSHQVSGYPDGTKVLIDVK